MKTYINTEGKTSHFIGGVPESWREMTEQEVRQFEEKIQEQERLSRTITKRQLWLWLYRNKNKTKADIIALIGDNQEALIELEDAQEFVRSHPMFDAVGLMLGMTPADVDTMFTEAKEI